MSYSKIINWELIPQSCPHIIKNCPKCNKKSSYVNTGNFRVNANGNSIDVWLIYQCHKCKSTLNLSIYERTKPKQIPKDEYDRFLSNDQKLALQYGYNISFLRKNRVTADYEDTAYQLAVSEEGCEAYDGIQQIIIRNQYGFKVRLDKLLADQLMVSRTNIKKWIREGSIYSKQDTNLVKAFVTDRMNVVIRVKSQ